VTDGPFKNAPMPRRWKSYGDELGCDATSRDERVKLYCDNVIADMGLRQLAPLLKELNAYAERCETHRELFPAVTVDGIIRKHEVAPSVMTLQKNLAVNLSDKMSVKQALSAAIGSFAGECLAGSGNRINDALTSARGRGEMNAAVFAKCKQRHKETVSGVNKGEFVNAVMSGNHQAYKACRQNINRSEEGPDA
jgi:hypothetical protein